MRRLDLQPGKKLRNPARHLRRLATWPARIVQQMPNAADLNASRYWNFKIPVYSKVADPPHATSRTRRACLAATFAAAEAVEHSPSRPSDCRVACLVTTPFLFESEVTLFADEDYFRSLLPAKECMRAENDGGWIEASPAGRVQIGTNLPPVPAGLTLMGGTRLIEHDNEYRQTTVERVIWVWAYPRR